MANQEQLDILRQGVKTWNTWRVENLDVQVDLSHADLSHVDLSYANLRKAHLIAADLRFANLREANLGNAELSNALSQTLFPNVQENSFDYA